LPDETELLPSAETTEAGGTRALLASETPDEFTATQERERPRSTTVLAAPPSSPNLRIELRSSE
jgi:hypothetical protein